MAHSLLKMAQNNTLPEFQYMDRETLSWIESQNPCYKEQYSQNAIPPAIAAVLSLPLLPWFFADTRIMTSIHGVRHARRVAYYCFLIAAARGFGEPPTTNLVITGLLHDIRRANDKGDPGHGTASAEWFTKNIAKIEKVWNIRLAELEPQLIHQTIALHETPYSELSDRAYDEFATEVDILKTADALDRYRLPKKKWWINDQYLSYVPPDWLKQTAYNLVVSSENICLETDKIDCVCDVLFGGKNG